MANNQSITISVLIISSIFLVVSLIFPMIPNECCRNTLNLANTNTGNANCLCSYTEQSWAVPVLKYAFPFLIGVIYYYLNNKKAKFIDYLILIFVGYLGIAVVYLFSPYIHSFGKEYILM